MGRNAVQDMKNAIAAMVRALRDSQIEVPPKPTARSRALTVEWEMGVTDQATRALEGTFLMFHCCSPVAVESRSTSVMNFSISSQASLASVNCG